MIVENMPGAGHLVGANYLYNQAPKDGTAIGTFVETHVTNQLSGGKGIELDPRPGDQVQAGMKAVLDTPKVAAERFAKLMAQ